jgi:hypothetical protein
MAAGRVSEERFRELVEAARSSDEILGLYVFGSRAFDDERRDDRSDYDVGLVVSDDAHEELSRRWSSVHGDSLEVFCFTLDGLRAHAEHGSPNAWARPLFLWVDLVVDKTGELAPLIAAKQRVPEGERGLLVDEALGAYVNSTYRFLRYGTRLDAVESVSPLLTLAFALEGRVRPFNKHLERELAHRPLSSFDAGGLLASIERVLDGDRAAGHALFRDVERAARADGRAAALDVWEPDLAWLRGEAGYREAR